MTPLEPKITMEMSENVDLVRLRTLVKAIYQAAPHMEPAAYQTWIVRLLSEEPLAK